MLKGFIIFDHQSRFAEARKQLAGWLATGELKRKEWIMEGGIEKAEEGLQALFDGRNLGKCLVRVSKEKNEKSRL